MDTSMISIGIVLSILGFVAFKFLDLKGRQKTEAKAKIATTYDYDVVIVGGSIAGPMAAKKFSDQGRKVLMIERDGFEKPDRIVGELMQPGGMNLLQEVGMLECATSIGMKCTGYVTIHDDEWVQLPYEEGAKGVSFHFGDFVQNLRKFVRENCSKNVVMEGGSVNDIVLDRDRVVGVEYTPKGEGSTKKKVSAPLVVMCDGGSSKWKGVHQHYQAAAKPHSHFVGIVLSGMTMPHETKGHVFLGKSGPILSYRLDANEVRVLAAFTGATLPKDVKGWLVNEVAPQMPENYHAAMKAAVEVPNNVRSMPINQYEQTFPCVKGYVGLGDHTNQRHPLTGGGMTCAMRDAVAFTKECKDIKSLGGDFDSTQAAILSFTRTRNGHCSTINILSWALYAVFSGPHSMRTACFAYFKLGGDCVKVPMALLSGLQNSGLVLLYHYYRVMAYGAWILMYRKSWADFFSFFVSPARLWDAIYLLGYATYVFMPLVWIEFVSIWRYLDPTAYKTANKK